MLGVLHLATHRVCHNTVHGTQLAGRIGDVGTGMTSVRVQGWDGLSPRTETVGTFSASAPTAVSRQAHPPREERWNEGEQGALWHLFSDPQIP